MSIYIEQKIPKVRAHISNSNSLSVEASHVSQNTACITLRFVDWQSQQASEAMLFLRDEQMIELGEAIRVYNQERTMDQYPDQNTEVRRSEKISA